MENRHILSIDNSVWELFVQFFREVKGYSDWSDDEIDLSMNNDDIVEFVKWLSEVETETPLTIELCLAKRTDGSEKELS